MDNQPTQKKVEAAKKREEAARLRSLAAGQKSNAAAHLRQSGKPIYAGQAETCIDKANQIESFAQENLAKAARLEAEADALEASL